MDSQKEGISWARIILGVISVIISIALTTFVYIWFSPTGIGQEIESRCLVNGLGDGSCAFTNMGTTPGTKCVEVKLVNQENQSVSSGTTCSGRVSPRDTIDKKIHIILGNHCEDKTYSGKGWSDVCRMEVENR